MPDEMKNETSQETAAAPGKRRKGLFLGGGLLGLVASAYIVSMVALPGEAGPTPFVGPFVTPLSDTDIQVNLKGDGGRRYLVMSLQARYVGYDEDYVRRRVGDVVYQADMLDALISLGRRKTMADVEDQLGEETFMEEVRDAVDPLLFPIHVGNEESAYDPHEESGLAPGRSIRSATMRGGFRSHRVHVDGAKQQIRLDEGPPQTFDGTERDLQLENEDGQTVFLDLTGLEEGWSGAVEVGTFGRIQAIRRSKFITQ